MVSELLGQLESLSRSWQTRKIKNKYPDLTGIKIENGRLWQHPGTLRQSILSQYRRRIDGLDSLL